VEIKGNVAMAEEQVPVDVKRLLAPPSLEEVKIEFDPEADTKLEIWRVDEFERYPHPKHLYGEFWAGLLGFVVQ